MRGHAHRATGLCLVLILLNGLTPRAAHAEGGNKGGWIPVHATGTFSLIGKVYSLGGILINGRRASAEQMLWNGDMLQAQDNASARAVVDSIGQVTIARGTTVRLATTTTLEDSTKHDVLIVSLTIGEMTVKLGQNAGAYIETGGVSFTASFGASFRIEMRGGEAVVDTNRGFVRIEPQPRRPIAKARDVNAPPNAAVAQIPKTRLDRKPNQPASGQLQWQIYLQSTTRLTASTAPRLVPVSNQTTQIEKPIVDRMVRFEIVDSNGVTSTLAAIQDQKTDNRGVVTYTFQAGGRQGAGQIRARIDPDPNQDPPDTEYETYTRDFRIKTFWTLRNKLLIAAAAAAVVGCVVGCRSKGPLQQVPPPNTP
ncbi:MAG TPA: hypothetical protein VN687_09095 [Blastocatellia bacterium]|nr:hypothetical protein [Blastocatellia bacterium]